MAFRISDAVSNRPWGDVDKTRIRQELTKALEAGESGVRDVIREVYAVIKGGNVAQAPSQNWWGPHHEIQDDGTVVLNVNGLIAAVQAIGGGRATPDLTADERKEAARHLLRHYRELKREPPSTLLEAAGERPQGEMVRVAAGTVAEMASVDIPPAPWANLDALKAGDAEPLEVVVRIPEGKSKRGWYYTRRVLERIAAEINATGLPGILGHQSPDAVDREFAPPVTHWVGAVVRDEGGRAALYARGVIDKAAADLKRWIKGNVIRQVSIFGVPTLVQSAGETHVVDFHPLSIDWTPLNRAGMPTQVVAVGEMDVIGEGGGYPMSIREALGALREAVARKEVTVQGVIGEMGLHADQVVEEIGGDRWRAAQAAAKVVGEMGGLFGLGADAKPDAVLAAVKAAREAQMEAAKRERAATIDRVVGEMVQVEAVRPLVRRIAEASLPEAADEQAIRQAVGEVLAQDDVRRALASAFGEQVIAPVQAQGGGPALLLRRVTI